MTASAICLCLTLQSPPHAAIGFTIATGGWAGVCYLISLLYYFAAVARLGMSLATAAIRISVALPVLAALLVWHERLHPAQAAGLLLVGVALLGLAADGGSGTGRGRHARRTASLGNEGALLSDPLRPGPGGDAVKSGRASRNGGGGSGHRLDPRILLGLILPLFLVTGAGQVAARIFSGGAPAANAALYSAAVFAAAALSAFVALADPSCPTAPRRHPARRPPGCHQRNHQPAAAPRPARAALLRRFLHLQRRQRGPGRGHRRDHLGRATRQARYRRDPRRHRRRGPARPLIGGASRIERTPHAPHQSTIQPAAGQVPPPPASRHR